MVVAEKVEAEKASQEATRWRELSKAAEDSLASKQEEALHFRTQFEAMRLQVERLPPPRLLPRPLAPRRKIYHRPRQIRNSQEARE